MRPYPVVRFGRVDAMLVGTTAALDLAIAMEVEYDRLIQREEAVEIPVR